MQRGIKKILLVSIFVPGLYFPGCNSSAKNYPVDLVERNGVSSLDKKANPLMLVVEIGADGRLNLNKIETGTISDVSDLSEKIKVIFNDREKAGINEREVLIDSKIKAEGEGFEKLVKTLADLKASPIRIIKNDP